MKDLISDAESLLSASAFSDGVDRRVFLKAAMGSGFAVAALPVVAQTQIQTSLDGLDAGEHIIVINGRTSRSTAPSPRTAPTCRWCW